MGKIENVGKQSTTQRLYSLSGFENYKILELAKSMGTYKDTTNMSKAAIEWYEDAILANWFPLIARNFFKMLAKA